MNKRTSLLLSLLVSMFYVGLLMGYSDDKATVVNEETTIEDLNKGGGSLVWIGGAPTGLPSNGSTVFYKEGSSGLCDGDFCGGAAAPFSGGNWLDNSDAINPVTFSWEVMEWIHFEGGCPPYDIIYSHTPCGTEGGNLVDATYDDTTVTSVQVIVVDGSGCIISWDYKVSWECGTGCGSNNTILCSNCGEDACFVCDLWKLRGGFHKQ